MNSKRVLAIAAVAIAKREDATQFRTVEQQVADAIEVNRQRKLERIQRRRLARPALKVEHP